MNIQSEVSLDEVTSIKQCKLVNSTLHYKHIHAERLNVTREICVAVFAILCTISLECLCLDSQILHWTILADNPNAQESVYCVYLL